MTFVCFEEGGSINDEFVDGDYIVLFRMKKRSCSSQGSDKSVECPPKKEIKYITFDYNNNLQCFITSSSQALNKPPSTHKDKPPKPNPPLLAPSPSHDKQSPLAQLRVPRKNREKIASNSKPAFNNSILLLEY